uniref:Uncharacterized protein n=1 Tax=Anguilla anguilla TaxID=7936 RepID=A0A0E9TND4_ANGAN
MAEVSPNLVRYDDVEEASFLQNRLRSCPILHFSFTLCTLGLNC